MNRDDRTLVMTNVRSSAPSYVAFDDDALNELEAAARLVGTSGGSRPVYASAAGPMPGAHPRMTTSRPIAPKPRTGIVALVAGGFVALLTGATLLFYFAVP